MNSDQINGVVRAVLPALLAFAVAKGWIGAGSVDWIVASAVTLIAAGWSIWSNKPGTVIPPKA
jgi:hypothetical protein